MSFISKIFVGNQNAEFKTKPEDLRDKGVDTLVLSYAPLARKIASQLHRKISTKSELDDFIQTAMIALIESARSYRDMGYSFATYAAIKIRGAIIDHVRKDAIMCRSAIAMRKQLIIKREALAQKLCRQPSEAELASEMGMKRDVFRAAQEKSASPIVHSIDEKYNDHDASFASSEQSADTYVETMSELQAMQNCMRLLPERQARILHLFFIEERPLDAIGAELGIGSARVCQIKKEAIDSLSELLLPLIK